MLTRVFLGLWLVSWATAAFAQTTLTGESMFGAWRPYLLEVAGILVTAGVAYLGVKLRQWFNYSIEEKHREALQTALTNAAGFAIAQAGKALADKKIEVTNPYVANAAKYVSEGVPEALRHFDITPSRLREMVLAKLPQVAPETPETKTVVRRNLERDDHA